MGFGKFIFDFSTLFSIQRWNNKPAIIKFYEADNAFSSLFFSYFFRKSLDLPFEEAIKWRLYRELPKVVLSDISLQLKERIQSISPNVWNNLREKAINEISSNLKNDGFIEKIISRDANIIDLLADYSVSYLEAKENNKVFDYSTPVEELSKKIENLKVENIEKYIKLSEVLWEPTLNLISLSRWNKTYRNVKTSVAGHTFLVVTISYVISMLLEIDNDIEEILSKALLHDLPEAFTGDVITPTKKKIEGLDDMITAVERDFVKEWLKSLEFFEIFKSERILGYSSNPFSEYTGKIVRTADLLSALVECALEIQSGNKTGTFRKVFFDFKKQIKEISPIDVSEWIDEIETIVF